LDGRTSYDPYGGNIIAYQWTQILPASPTTAPTPPGVSQQQPPSIAVILQGANTATPTFIAPILPYDTILAFSLRVMDSDGGAVSSNPAIVYIMAKHNNPINNSPLIGGSSNTLGNIIINPQHQQQQPLVPNNNNNNNLVPSVTPQPNIPPSPLQPIH
jgi:hypothetical protein